MAYALLAIFSLALVAVSANVLPESVETDIFALIDQDKHREELLEHYGKFMLSNMNQSVNPCEDFFEYACGGWKESTMLPPEARNTSLLLAIQHRINQKVLGFLQNTTSLSQNQTNPFSTAEGKAKQFFASCVKMKANMSLGYERHMEQQDDRYAAVGQQHYQNASLDWIYMNFMSNYEIYPLLPLKIHYNTASRKFDIMLTVPTKLFGGLKEEQLHNMTKDFQLTDEKRRQEFLHTIANLTHFEGNLTQLVKVRNETEKLTLGEFLKVHREDRLNWTLYFDVAFNGSQKNHWPIQNQLHDVADLVYFLEHSELELLRAFVQYRSLFKFYNIWKVQGPNGSRIADECRSITETYYNYALLPWFIDQVFDPQRREDVLNVAKDIRDTFYELLDQYSWLDDETRSQAKTKLAAMDVLVGYSDELSHRQFIDQVYNKFNMTNNWYENLAILELNRARLRHKSVDNALIPQLMPTRTVNAYYADFLNQAFITIGMAQFPLYHVDFPDVLKFAGIGNIIGHEMAHGFDSYCYQFNYDGKKSNWWSTASLRNFKERYRCLESQYNKFILMGVATNGTLTSGDNIADNVGVRMAYHAYKRHTTDKAWQQKPLRTLDYNNKQLFFLKFAQTWCTGKDDAYKLKKFKTDVHAYEAFRVVGTLSNMPEFSEAFGCKLGTDMNPLKKCVVW